MERSPTGKALALDVRSLLTPFAIRFDSRNLASIVTRLSLAEEIISCRRTSQLAVAVAPEPTVATWTICDWVSNLRAKLE